MKNVVIFASIQVRAYKSIQVQVEDDFEPNTDSVHDEDVQNQIQSALAGFGAGWDVEVDEEEYEWVDDSCPRT